MKSKSSRHNPRNKTLPQGVRNISSAKEEPSEEIVLQFGANEVSIAAISDKVKSSFRENFHDAVIKDIKIYVKPEDNKAYYIINDETQGSIDLA